MEKHSPAWLLVDGHCDILRFSGGEAGRYLEPSSGAASLNLFAILRKTLRPVVRAAVRTTLATKEAVVNENVAIRIDGANRQVAVIVEPLLGEAEAGFCVVAFRETGTRDLLMEEVGASRDTDVQAVEHELRTVKTQLQSTIDELETANEEMKSAAEEYQSVNEEFQSSNEELETSKEEMQSINEELQTVNAELASKNDALARVNSDIRNLLDSTEIATLFLDGELRIKSFTPTMREIFHLRDADRGRPITDIVSLLNYPDIKKDVEDVMRKLAAIEREVQHHDNGMTFILRIRPYRTVDNVINGVVMTFMDISERKEAENHSGLLLSELDHRVKNILSIISSVIKQTLKSSETPAAFTANMEGRIAAIARAHSLLTRDGGRDEASLHELIQRELAPFDHRGNNLQISGPDVMLTPNAGLTLAMAIHELASNASKYGALSKPHGRLAVTWSSDGDTADPGLTLVWAESDGPPVQPPNRSGFGTTLIERTLSHDLDGKVNREFLAAGLRCTIEIPLTRDIGHLSRPGRKSEGKAP